MIAEEYGAMRQIDHERMLTYAYSIAAWGRVKRMPKLEKVLEEARPKQVASQTPEQMLAFVKQLQAKRKEEKDRGRR